MPKATSLLQTQPDPPLDITPDQSTPAAGAMHKKHGNLEAMITSILQELCVPAHISGYFYLREAIIFAVNKMDIITGITKTLYPNIAELFNTTASRVERSIRHAIEIAWDRCDPKSRYKFFYFDLSYIQYRPTNSEFIATIADYIKIQIKSENENDISINSFAIAACPAIIGSEFVAINHLNFLADEAVL